MTKDQLIKKYRYINVEHNWWEWVYSEFISDMEKVGISLSDNDIEFDGFYHQGGYAFFDFDLRSSVNTFMDSHNLTNTYRAIYDLAFEGGVSIGMAGGRGRQARLIVQAEDWAYFGICEDEDMNAYYQAQKQEEVETTFKEFEEDVEKIIEGYQDDLYKSLQREYENLTDDEVVWETIQGNELDDEWDENINRGLKIGGHYA